MPSFSVVEHLDVFEYFRCCYGPCHKDLLSHQFPFERLEEAFGERVVVAIPPTAHARDDVMIFEERLVVVRAVLASLIRMQYYFLITLPDPMYGLLQSSEHQRSCLPVVRRPPDHFSAVKVDDNGEMQPSLVRPDVGDVTDPALIGVFGNETLLQVVRMGFVPGTGLVVRLALVGADTEKPGLAHQARDALFVHVNSGRLEILVDIPVPVDAIRLFIGALDMLQDFLILNISVRHRFLQPFVIAAWMHFQCGTHPTNPIDPGMFFDKCVL